MNRVRRIAGIGKAKVPSAVQKDRDESIVFFRELYKREKDNKDVNLLEPMNSVEFEAIQGGHGCKVPPGKRDFLIPVDEKHDYDWLMTPPAESTFTWIVVRGGQGRSAPSPSTASKAYSFDTMHWHAPSDHTINGQRFPS